MDVKKTKPITDINILILILFVLGGYFIWTVFFKTAKTKPEQVSIPSTAPGIRVPDFKPVEVSGMPLPAFEEPVSKLGEAAPIQTSQIEELTIPTLPIPKPNLGILFKETSLPTSTMSFFENIRKAAETVETEATSTEILLSLTNDEFHFLYPDFFIASLMKAQDLLKEYDPTYEPLLKIETDSQVRFVEEKVIAALFSVNMVAKEEMERFITTIRFTLPQLQLTELKNQKSSSLKQPSINQSSVLSQRPALKRSFFAEFIERLYSAFVPAVQAGGGGPCGYCYVLPECFQVGIPMPIPGYNVWKAFCYCTGCLYGQGCLDFCEGMSAIWDPMTGICGCG